MKNISPDAFGRAILDALKAVGAPLAAITVRLFVNDFQPTRLSVLADFTAATFDGYAESSAVVWGTSYTDVNGVAHLVGDLKQFTATGATVQQTVYGFYLVTTTTLKAAQRFQNPVPISAAGDAVLVVPTFELENADAPDLGGV